MFRKNYKFVVNGYNTTNIQIGKTEVSGPKRRKDDKVEDRPTSIKLHLLRNKVVLDTMTVTSIDNCKYSFPELDKYDQDGKYYEYTLSEFCVPGYTQ